MKRFLVAAALAAATLTAPATEPATNAYPGEPAYVEAYRQAALALVDSVTSSTDGLKAFNTSPAVRDLATSSAVRQQLAHKIEVLEGQMRLVNSALLSTATQVLDSSKMTLFAAESMSRHVEGSN